MRQPLLDPDPAPIPPGPPIPIFVIVISLCTGSKGSKGCRRPDPAVVAPAPNSHPSHVRFRFFHLGCRCEILIVAGRGGASVFLHLLLSAQSCTIRREHMRVRRPPYLRSRGLYVAMSVIGARVGTPDFASPGCWILVWAGRFFLSLPFSAQSRLKIHASGGRIARTVSTIGANMAAGSISHLQVARGLVPVARLPSTTPRLHSIYFCVCFLGVTLAPKVWAREGGTIVGC